MSFEEVRALEAQTSDTDFPVLGETIDGLRDYLIQNKRLPDEQAFDRVQRDAVAILRRCRRFSDSDGSITGLVVGYVQSGKTLSMTAVSALARDNGCRLIIALAGVTNLLLKQSQDRFRDDLRGASRKNSAWRILNSADGFGSGSVQELKRIVAEWKDPAFNQDPQTLLYVVLKNHSHLDALYQLLRNANLSGVPALIIDDEADQAGLNTSPDDPEASTTYTKIARVRSALPHHTYLQYTATPQAPLLIALDDMLSPAFAELVEPGKGYTGGTAFFGVDADPNLVIKIPDEDLFRPGEPPPAPPESLLAALRVFFVGCAVAAIQGKPVPRSMLVHPSPRTSDHKQYVYWIAEVIKRWTTSLRSKDQHDRDETHEEFLAAHSELTKTHAQLPSFDVLAPRLLISLGRVSLKEVNSQDGTEIDWNNADEHILVGGEKLNRGFTVEGLTVTYMPRDAGGWNADTIQQRARFFGYKAGYLSLCRLYLHEDVVSAFRSYVRHEDDIRRQLAAHRGRPLREWRRAFFLDKQMKPTRRNVLSDPFYAISKDKLWFTQRHPHEANIARNRDLCDALIKQHEFSSRTGFFGNAVAECRLKDVYEQMLVTFDTRGSDVQQFYGQLVTIADILDTDPDSKVLLIQMSGEDGRRGRQRGLNKGGDIGIQQGRSSSKKEGAYPGDRELIDPNAVTIQFNFIDIKLSGPTNVPALAIHIPEALRRDDVGVQVS